MPSAASAFFAMLLVACALCAPATAWGDELGGSAGGASTGGDLVAASIQVQAAPTTELTESELESASSSYATDDVGQTMYRLYNPNSGEHFYTANADERDYVADAGWNYEGIGWYAPSAGDEVYRLYNPNAGDHHYTPNAEERDNLIAVGWRDEGVGWFSGGDCAILRQYNPNAVAGAHNFTYSQDENDYLASVGWRAEGVGWYALADTEQAFDSFTQRVLAGVVARIEAGEKELHVVSAAADDTNYLLLPSYADLSAVRLSAVFQGEETPIMVADYGSTDFAEVQAGEAVDIASLSTQTAENGARLLWYKAGESPVVQKLAVMVSSAVSAVHVSSVDVDQDRAYVEGSKDHTAKADVNITVVGNDGALLYDKDGDGGSSTIKGRGNTTWTAGDKKPYQISLNKKADLLRTGDDANAQKKWILLANANDVTLLHNTVAYDMALELGMVGTECRPVDLYYDGQYRGNYLLSEKIQVKEGRVDIDDLEEAVEEANPDVDFESLPTAKGVNEFGFKYQYVNGLEQPEQYFNLGGFLLELDSAYYEKEACWFECSWGPVVVKSPEFCTKGMMAYISEYVERAITRLADEGKSAEEPGNSSGALINLESLAKTYLVNELAKNVDAFYTSTYLYKDSGPSPLYVQPVWDFDGSMGIRNDWDNSLYMSYQGFVLSNASKVSSIEAVQDKVREVWTDELSDLVGNVLLSLDASMEGARGFLHSLTYYRQQIADSQKMDEVVFGLTAFSNVLAPFETYEANFNYLFNWFGWRKAWLDDNIGNFSGGGEVENTPWTLDGVDYGLVFDAGYYKAHNSAVDGVSDLVALKHFVASGMSQGFVASRNFDVHAYQRLNPDLVERFGDDLEQYYLHYIETGFKEGRLAV